MKILIDNGHGENTPGKCSPDKRLKEWEYNRLIASEVVRRLQSMGYDAELIVEETKDISLKERVRRVNLWCDRLGTANVVFVSIHVNAAGKGGWYKASGWSGYVAPKASEKSRELARMLYCEVEKRGLRGNRSVPKDRFWTGNFTVLTRTKCPAVLTENMFQDNLEDVGYLLSEKGKCEIIGLHIAALKDYVAKYETHKTNLGSI